MKLVLFISFILISLKSLGQSDYVKIYYPTINKAELAITRENYTEAISFYKQAFASVKSPFARDLFNAFVCKVLSGDFEGSKPYLFKLAQKGIDPAVLEKKEIFYLLKSKPEWENFKLTYSQIWESRPQNDTRDLIVSMYNNYRADADSVFNHSEVEVATDTKKKIYKNHRVYREEVKNDTASHKFLTLSYRNIQEKVDSVEIKYREKVEDYLKTNTWPSEDELGVENSDPGFSSNLFNQLVNNQYNTYIFNIPSGNTLTLYTDKKKDSDQMLSYIVKAINEGRLAPTQASMFRMRNIPRLAEVFKATVEDTTGCSNFPEISSKIDKWLIKKRSLNTAEKDYYTYIEKNFFMSPVDDIYQKIIYQALKNKYFIFPQNIHREETTIPSCETALNILKEATLIEEN